MDQYTSTSLDGVGNVPKFWTERLKQFAERVLGAEKGGQLWQKYQAEFPLEYQNLVSPKYALQDIQHLEQTGATGDQVSLLNPSQAVEHFRIHFYSQQQRYLDEYIPVLENLHLRVMDQVQFAVAVDGKTLFIRSFTIKAGAGQCDSLPKLRQRLLAMVMAVLAAKAENDPLNKLLVLAGLSWQEIEVLRAYQNYYLQLGLRVSSASIQHALLKNPTVAAGLFNYFEARFRPDPAWEDPVVREEQALFPLRLQLLEHIAAVLDINDDRILRNLFNLIDATMRSSFHVRKDHTDFFVAFKINSLGVIDMPAPKPQYEIFVHAKDMQGIHLRAGKISRGGIRWSDRPDDFRSEILGLMQTQISKNSLIIPTGAKGGFVLKQNGSPLDFKSAGKNAYLTLMHGLLDLTDNYLHGKVVKPNNIVAYDDPDPYLVVAADKGTAKFSDIANEVSADYQFWLGDAFASGGSHGYDHKALGITARGAWECIKRHFLELGKDIQSQAFSVVGIGSMDGDVFGNGMLLSPYIRLKAAFSGQHIFIDPSPAETEAAFNERKRLFDLPGSSWVDYDRTLISAGGGVYNRADKAIPISPELQHWLGIRYKTLDGEALVRYLLTANVDLIWLGGIGTYVKASSEKHEDVGDRSNDNVRVDAAAIRAKVVGEGANLGFTQKARIEYALKGGLINTDAVDNSAGVDTSDHEVNLKILLTGLQKQGLIQDYQALFIDMTEAVCDLVLADNIDQSLCLSMQQRRSAENPDGFLQLAERLENMGFLDRVVESFPANKEILSRPGQTLTRPELAVLVSTSKRYLTLQIQNQIGQLQDACCDCYLSAYFPAQIQAQFSGHLASHPLADAIKATVVSNKIINQAGCEFLNLNDDTENTNILDLVNCYLLFDRVLQADGLRQAIHGLGGQIDADKQYQLLLELEAILVGFCRWTNTHGIRLGQDAATLACYSSYFDGYKTYFLHAENSQAGLKQAQLTQYQQAGLPESLVQQLLLMASLKDFPFAVAIAKETGQDMADVLDALQDSVDFLGLPSIYAQLAKLPKQDYWQSKVLAQVEGDIQIALGQVLKKMLSAKSASCANYFAQANGNQKIGRYRKLYQQVLAAPPANLLPYVALAKALDNIVE